MRRTLSQRDRARNVRGDGADRGTSIATSISLDWQIARDWSLDASFYEIRGVLYLDTNGNGIRDGGESGAAHVVVMLDGKFTTPTNSQGAFEFPAVAAGAHSITVLADDLPLPWTLEPERKFNAPVTTRGNTRIDIGAKRMP